MENQGAKTQVSDERPLLFIIFGITGDLAHRKLLPAIYALSEKGLLPKSFQILGITRQQHSVTQFYDDFIAKSKANLSVDTLNQLRSATKIITLDMSSSDDYVMLREQIELVSGRLGDSNRIYYLSIPAQAFTEVITHLGESGHADKLGNESESPRILVEKPFGYNLSSAEKLVDAAEKHFTDSQIYRIDHYLAKETAQNILTFRFNNSLFENIWNSHNIDQIKITAFESIGIEGRAQFYEQTGALRDLVQSHLAQLLALVTMEQPGSFDSASIHRSKLRLLDSVMPILPDEVNTRTVRGQYDSYRAETNNPSSNTETFARLRLAIDNEKWRGTDVILETGKALHERCSTITIRFRSTMPDLPANILTFRIQPHEGITLTLQAKKPGLDNSTETVEMDFDYLRSFGANSAEAYQRVIIDAVHGDQSLFLSSQEVISSWKIFENVIKSWENSGDNLKIYPFGSNPDEI